jgi:hypothetical protein
MQVAAHACLPPLPLPPPPSPFTYWHPLQACVQATEIGPHTDRRGPCLVHFKGSQLSPEALNAWIAGNWSASTAVVRVFWLGDSPCEAHSLADLLRQLLAAGPPAGGGSIRLQCSPRSLESWLGDQLPLSFNLQPVDPAWVLHIVRLPPAAAQEGLQQQQQPQQMGQDGQDLAQQEQQEQPPQWEQPWEHSQPGERFLFSLQPAAALYTYESVRGKRLPNQLCKAAGKLAEALQVTGLELTSGVAVDLGAAPGAGWGGVAVQGQRALSDGFWCAAHAWRGRAVRWWLGCPRCVTALCVEWPSSRHTALSPSAATSHTPTAHRPASLPPCPSPCRRLDARAGFSGSPGDCR